MSQPCRKTNILFSTAAALTGAIALLSAPVVAQDSPLPDLRILPLGDSITKGSGSTDGNGYRGPLRTLLMDLENGKNNSKRDDGSELKVDMIGTLQNGKMMDNDHEGHSGKFLADIKGYWNESINARPNVVLLNAGTNNMDKNIDVDTAPELISSIIDGIFEHAPDTVLLVAPVLWSNNATTAGLDMQSRTSTFNDQLKAIVDKRQKDDKHILSVPIEIPSAKYLYDFKHPNDAGYKLMANAWFGAIKESNSRGWLKAPMEVKANDLKGLGLGQRARVGGDSGEGGGSDDGSGNGKDDGKGDSNDDDENDGKGDSSDDSKDKENAATPVNQWSMGAATGAVLISLLGAFAT